MGKINFGEIAKDFSETAAKHAPEILIGFGIAGMLTTTVLAVKATPKALKNIEEKIKKYEGLIVFDCENNKGKWKKSFGNDNPIYLEIGMGKGKFILKHAMTNPDINYIGCEISDSVIYKAAEKAEGVSNLLMINKDASLLNDIFEEKEISNVRFFVYKCLYNIYVNKAFSNIEIDHIIRENKINELDAKLLTNIVYGIIVIIIEDNNIVNTCSY